MIYFIRIGADGPIKVGFTGGDPQKRLRQLQIACPYRLELIAVSDGTLDDERRLHSRFGKTRLQGEWFNLTPELTAIMAPSMLPVPVLAELGRRPGRPLAVDPTMQMPIYMRRSQIERLEARADKLGVKPAALAAEMVEQGLDLREGGDASNPG